MRIRHADYESKFQFTPLREGRPKRTSLKNSERKNFNSRPCGRGDFADEDKVKRPLTISIHAPAGGATRRSQLHRSGHKNFNSRPCGRGDQTVKRLAVEQPISIHAPAGGATHARRRRGDDLDISIHAPAGGATQGRLVVVVVAQPISIHAPAGGATCNGNQGQLCATYFNSRPCGRGDGKPLCKWQIKVISIHAPAGGATGQVIQQVVADVFQFTPLREGRQIRRQPMTKNKIFQFTPLREGRPRTSFIWSALYYFNSRPCGRGDRSPAPSFARLLISIHAPAGGATGSTIYCHVAKVFQFTPLREGRRRF